jgi:hypothetical protein
MPHSILKEISQETLSLSRRFKIAVESYNAKSETGWLPLPSPILELL